MGTGWIAIDKTLPYKPEIATLCKKLSITREKAVMGCILVWAWADEITTDGNLGEQRLEDVDFIAHIDGFGRTMRDVGWLVERDGLLSIPNFHRWNSKSAKARIQAARRQALCRDRRRGSSATEVTQRA